MARTHAAAGPKVPHEHLSVFTWIAFVAIVLVVLALVAWAIWFAGPTIQR